MAARVSKPKAEGGGFAGFGRGLPSFFAELAEHQSRDWFLANKPRYESDILRPMEALLASLTLALAAQDIPLIGTKASVFRINRDVRFSRDKSPYKTNVGAVLTRTGTKASQGVLYVHAGAAEAFLALGFYNPEPDQLSALRVAILARPDRWRGIAHDLEEAALPLSREYMAARLPRGYDAAEVGDLAEWLRLKSFIVRRDLPPASLYGPGLVKPIADFAAAGQPLLRFGWQALADLPPREGARTRR
jgi:uncharacterized protein (TIGR02453 family)